MSNGVRRRLINALSSRQGLDAGQSGFVKRAIQGARITFLLADFVMRHQLLEGPKPALNGSFLSRSRNWLWRVY
jgi:hypothetical protein